MARKLVGLPSGHGLDAEQLDRSDLQPTEGQKYAAAVVPNTKLVLGNAKSLAWDQISVMQKKYRGNEMEMDEVKRFSMLVDSLTKLSREEREQAKRWNPDDWDDDDIQEALGDYFESQK